MERLFSTTELYEALSERLDRETARTLTDYVRVSVDDKFRSSKEKFVTKDFLRAELSQQAERIMKAINAVSEQYQKDLSSVMLKTIFAILIPIILLFLGVYLKK